MSATTKTAAFRVIDGGAGAFSSRTAVSVSPPPKLCAAELAADMAEVFALSLLRDAPLATLDDPHVRLSVDATTQASLHEVLCELRSLAWCDSARTLPAPDTPETGAPDTCSSSMASSSRACQGDEGHRRRALRWNGDGQLTLGTLFRGGVALPGASAQVSRLWPEAMTEDTALALEPMCPQPPETAQLEDWQAWSARHAGAGPSTRDHAQGAPLTLGDMARDVHRMPPARPFLSAALEALAQETPFDPGLSAASDWPIGRLMSLMATAERRAARAVLLQAALPDRLPRPVVTAARMTLWLAKDEQGQDPANRRHRAAAEELAEAAPRLLHWMTRANANQRGAQRFDTNVFLPLINDDDLPLLPSDCAPHVAVAGALATLLKAVFDCQGPSPLRMLGPGVPHPDLAQAVDLMAANVSVARVVSGGYLPCENHQQLRIGQAIALQLLREVLEVENRSAAVTLRDFDGRQVQVIAHPRSFRRGWAELWVDGVALPWPQDVAAPAAHLTAVV